MATQNDTHIEWTCNACGFPIADGAGSINIPFAHLSAHRPGRDLVWRARHDRCLATPDVYGIDVESLRTHWDVLRWTHHLMSKNWFVDSTWAGILSSIVWGRREADVS